MSAVVLQFPAKVQRQAKRRMNRVEVDARHRWMIRNRSKWETEETEGIDPRECLPPRVRQLMELLDKKWGAVKGPTMAEMRRDIAEGRKLIEKRNRVKAWIASLGVDLESIKDAEQALFAAFDELAARTGKRGAKA
ncbi:hypothetical protein [Rhodanobacter geophilus]|uniref:Uncharacterized protein n=1 Tax=Rhodanobacter geophilus TaxID=3162488 RepID=A0ABV3QLG4_9GAMM